MSIIDIAGRTVTPNEGETPTYHDLHITTPTMPRTSIFNLPYRVIVQCTRVGAWAVWARAEGGLPEENLGRDGFRLDVAGFVICDEMPDGDVLAQEGLK